MVSRRTSARLELALLAVALRFLLRLRRLMWDHEERWRDDDSIGPPPTLSASEAALGAAEQVAYHWAHDRDVWEIRSCRRRRYLASALRFLARRVLLSRDEAARYSRGVGGMAGTVLYRVWYGLLRPLPGSDAD